MYLGCTDGKMVKLWQIAPQVSKHGEVSHGLGVDNRLQGLIFGLCMHDINKLLQEPTFSCMTTHLLSLL